MHVKENSFTLIVDKNDYNMYYKMHAHLRLRDLECFAVSSTALHRSAYVYHQFFL